MSLLLDDASKSTIDSNLPDRIDTMLQRMLMQGGNYKEKQLVKEGKLAECIHSMLLRTNRAQKRFMWMMPLMVVVPSLCMTAIAVFSPSTFSKPSSSTSLVLTGVIYLPVYMEIRIAQARMRMLMTIWLLTRPETTEEKADPMSQELEQLILENA